MGAMGYYGTMAHLWLGYGFPDVVLLLTNVEQIFKFRLDGSTASTNYVPATNECVEGRKGAGSTIRIAHALGPSSSKDRDPGRRLPTLLLPTLQKRKFCDSRIHTLPLRRTRSADVHRARLASPTSALLVVVHFTKDGGMRVREFPHRWAWSLCSERRNDGVKAGRLRVDETRGGVDGWETQVWAFGRDHVHFHAPSSLADVSATCIGDEPSHMLLKIAPCGCGSSRAAGCGLYAGGPRIGGVKVGKAGKKVWALRSRRGHVAAVSLRNECTMHDAVASSAFEAQAPNVRVKHKSQVSGQDGRDVDGLEGEHGRAVTSIRTVGTSGWPSVSFILQPDTFHKDRLDSENRIDFSCATRDEF
ncbi:hypothetical protein B0H13DRAFT_2476100 [Mycena leptocephala]|nr:hypothetical protein B0H13DRAFT_2476100 [Mycena leptocephala]